MTELPQWLWTGVIVPEGPLRPDSALENGAVAPHRSADDYRRVRSRVQPTEPRVLRVQTRGVAKTHERIKTATLSQFVGVLCG